MVSGRYQPAPSTTFHPNLKEESQQGVEALFVKMLYGLHNWRQQTLGSLLKNKDASGYS